MKKMIKCLRTNTLIFNNKKVPSPERIKEIISACKGKELQKIIVAMETESMSFILDFLRISSAMETEGKESKTYGQFHEELLSLMTHIKKTLKND